MEACDVLEVFNSEEQMSEDLMFHLRAGWPKRAVNANQPGTCSGLLEAGKP